MIDITIKIKINSIDKNIGLFCTILLLNAYTNNMIGKCITYNMYAKDEKTFKNAGKGIINLT